MNSDYKVPLKAMGVPDNWLTSLPTDQAFSETGLFGNQNTVCKPKDPKWSHTVKRLKSSWKIS